MSRTRRVFMTGFWTVGEQGVSVLSKLVLVPFFLKAWSERTYGDWIALSALVSVIQYADVGMDAHVNNMLTQSATQKDWERLRRDLASATLLYLCATGVALLGTAGLCGWLHLSGYFSGRALAGEAVGITAILGLELTSQLLLGFLSGLYRAFGRADLMQRINFFVRLLLFVVQLALLLHGAGALGIATAQAVIYGAAVLWLVTDVPRLDPHVVFSLTGASFRRAREFLGPSLRHLFVTLSQGLTQQGTILAIDAMVPLAVVQFTTTRTVATSVNQIVSLFTNSTWPELTRLDAQGNKAKLALANRLLAKLTCAVALPVLATLFFVGIPLYEVWTRGRAEANPTLLRLLLLDVLATVPWYATAFILVATSRIRALSNLYLIAGIVTVGLSIPAMKLGGVTGVGVVLLSVTVLLFNTLVPRWSMEAAGETFGDYVRGICLPYISIALVTFAAAWATNRFVAPWLLLHTGGDDAVVWLSAHTVRLAPIAVTLFKTAVVAVVSAVTGGGLAWRFSFRAEERAVLVQALRAVIGRRAPTVEPAV